MLTPPERLCIELERQRELGRPFRVAWPLALNVALRGLYWHRQVEWRTSFNELRRVWAASYSCPMARESAAGLFVPDDGQAERGTGRLIA